MLWKVGAIIFLGAINLALFFKMVWGPTGLAEYQSLKQQYQDLRQKIVALDQENRALSRDIRLMQSDGDYAEKIVRQKLHYLRDNEIVYIFSDSSDKAAK